MKRTRFAALLVAAALVLAPATAAIADEPSVDPEISYALDHLSGGVLIDAHTAQWPSLGITFTVSNGLTRSVGTCSTGYICAYSGTALNGNKLTLSGCSTWSTTAFGTIQSVANARTSGWVNARNSAGTNVAYAGYGTWTNTPTTVTSLACAGDGIV